MTVFLPKLSQKYVGGSLGSRDEESDCAELGLWHWKLGHYLHHLQLQQDLKGLSGDKQANYVDFLAVAIISLNSLACLFRVHLTLVCDN